MEILELRRLLRQNILHQIEDSNPVPHGREQMGAIWAEEQVALAVYRAEQIGKLEIEAMVRIACKLRENPAKRTLKSVFIVN